MNASLDAIYVYDAVRNARGKIVDFRFADVNTRGLKLLGVTRARLIGRSIIKLSPRVLTNGVFEEYLQVIATGRPLVKVVPFAAPWPNARWREPKQLHYQIMRLGDGVLITVRDVTAQKRAEAALRALPRHISEAQETERRRVARELHDGVNQMLVAARFRLREAQRLSEKTPDATLAEHVRRAEHAVGQAVSELRRISHGLRPQQLDDMGLVAALRSLFADFRERTRVRVSYRPSKPWCDLPAPIAETLYRIAQEALTNVERHARARQVRVRLQHTPQQIALRIADDGRGLAPSPRENVAGLGLLHMRERAEAAGGSLRVSARAGAGTEILVQIPLRIEKPRRHA